MGVCLECDAPGLRSCRQISKILAFVDKSRITCGVKEASIFVPILSTIRQLRIYIHSHKKTLPTG